MGSCVGVTFALETARRRHGTLLHYKTAVQGDRHLVCSRATSGFTLSFPVIFPPHIRQSASGSRIYASMTLDGKKNNIIVGYTLERCGFHILQ